MCWWSYVFNLLNCPARSRGQRATSISRWVFFMESHHPAKLDARKHSGNGDNIIFLIVEEHD